MKRNHLYEAIQFANDNKFYQAMALKALDDGVMIDMESAGGSSNRPAGSTEVSKHSG